MDGLERSDLEERSMIECWHCRWLEFRIWWDEEQKPCVARCMHPEREDVGEGRERCACFEEDDKNEKGLTC